MHAFAGILRPPLTGRPGKPRRQGLTMAIDKGLGPAATADLLQVAGEAVDFWKLAFGTAPLHPAPALQQKLAVLAAHGVVAYPGGTLLEVAALQGQALSFLRRVRSLGFGAVEVSCGTLDMDPADRRALIAAARDLGLTVLAEVGKKDPDRQPDPGALVDQARADLEAGAEYIVVEARDSGRGVGIWDRDGRLRDGAFAALAGALPLERVIWEAPDKDQQVTLICRLGPAVNLGNVPPQELLALEALRLGLRSDTLRAVADRVPAGAVGGAPR